MAVTRILLRGGARDIIVCDREGVLHEGRFPNLNESKAWLVYHTNPRKVSGRCADALRGAHVFIGVSGPGTVEARHLKRMASKPIIFALANPTPEIMPEEAGRIAFIMATGRSDYPNQINNVLAFPGIFRGALDVRARQITESMKQAAARAIAACITSRELSREYIIPSVFNREVAQRVAEAVKRAAIKAGVARKRA
jgi:malate dehydrogenase (oxaloacetate-decarboxylating)